MTTNPRAPAGSVASNSTAESAFANAGGTTSNTLQTGIQAAERRPAWSRWLRHLAILLFVLLCTVIGLWLALLPWSLQWTDNPLLWTRPDLRTFLGYGFVRGICSGFGLLDLWIGIREAADYYEKLGIPK